MKAKLISESGEIIKEIELPNTYPIPKVYIEGQTNIMYMIGATGDGCWEYDAVAYYVMGSKSESLIDNQGDIVK